MINDFLHLIKSGDYKVVDAAINTEPKTYSAVLPMCIDRMIASQLKFVELEPYDYGIIENGFMCGYYADSSITNKSHAMFVDEDTIITGDRDGQRINVYDSNMVLMRQIKTNVDGGMLYPFCAAATENSYLSGGYYKQIASFNKDDGSVEWVFGTYNSRGKCKDGKLGDVRKIDVLDDGNIILAVYDGADETDIYRGTVELFDTDGNYIKTLLEYKTTGDASIGEIYNPRDITHVGNTVYIGSSTRVDIMEYDSESQELSHINTIRKPQDVDVGELDLNSFCIDGDIMYIVSPAMVKVIAFNMITGDIEFAVGHYNYEAYSGAVHEANALNSPYGIAVINGRIFVSDLSNRYIVEVFRDDYIHPKYDIPENINVVSVSAEFNEDGRTNSPAGIEPPVLQLLYTEKEAI
jgi:hypothetical protein